jgi:hypothetical protein
MSWGVQAIGKASKVAEKLAAQFAGIKCSEPEETVKNQAAASIATALAAFPDSYAVEVNASGSQSSSQAEPGKFVNSLSVSIQPKHWFVE